MSTPQLLEPIDVLLVEDDPGDTFDDPRAFADNKVRNTLTCVTDAVEAMRLLRREGEHAERVAAGPDPARPQPPAQGRPRGARRDQGRLGAVRDPWS